MNSAAIDNIGLTGNPRANEAPVFVASVITGGPATQDQAYAGSLAESASDPDQMYGDTLAYAKVSGPEWLVVGAEGALSGTPTHADVGLNTFTVSATDSRGATATAVLAIWVAGTNASSRVVAAFYDFAGTTQPENYPPANHFEAGFTGGVTKGKASWDTGGSSDADLGDFDAGLFTVPQIPGGDGHLRIGADSVNEGAVVRVSNFSGRPWAMAELHFDAASKVIEQEVMVWSSYDLVSWSFLYGTGLMGPLAFAESGSLADYGDYGVSLAGLELPNGASIYFKFVTATSATALIDNIGVIGGAGGNDHRDANGNGILDGWEIGKFGNADPGANPAGADPDGDGLSNLMEFAMSTDPLTFNQSTAVVDFVEVGGAGYLRLAVPKNPVATNLIYEVQTSGDLGSWSAEDTVVEVDTGDLLAVRDVSSMKDSERRYIRLVVKVAP